eukprot:COSAG02_NODE_52480_length_307_cov_1.153846_1_plen_58_part_10
MMYDTKLSGTLGHAILQTDNPQLRLLYLHQTALSGTFSASLAALDNLENLDLHRTRLS